MAGKRNLTMMGTVSIITFVAIVCFILVVGTVLIKNDESYKTAITHIESNEKIKNQVGEIMGCSLGFLGELDYENGYGSADYKIKVRGDKQSIKVHVTLEKKPGDSWTVVHISY